MKTASRLVGSASFWEGRYAQDSPIYGAERRGAPMVALTRIADEPILERGLIAFPDIVVVADETLLEDAQARPLQGLTAAVGAWRSCVWPAKSWASAWCSSMPPAASPSWLFSPIPLSAAPGSIRPWEARRRGAQGVRDALDILLATGRLQPEDDVQVVVVAGDGSTYDMALSATSGTLYRQLDYWYICYDNEAYGNTGMQQSSATPYAARTATTAGDADLTEGVPLGKKDIFEIWRAHTPPYTATVSPRHPVDLARKFEKAKQFKGPKLFLAFAPCPTGWLYDPSQTQEYARLAVECGLFPLKEAVHGEVTHTYVKRRWRPVEEYLRGQGRFRHLFEPVRQEAILRAMQEAVDRYWVRVKA